MPLEYKGVISFEEQISVSRSGLKIILDLLRKFEIKATFFSTVVFAQNNLDLIKEIVGEGHELASHTYYHSKFDIKDLLSSKQELESLSGRQIQGLRMPRMMQTEREIISERTKQGLSAARAMGKVLGRPKGSKNKSRILDPHKDEITRLLSIGVSQSSVLKIINAKLDKSISMTALRYFLSKELK